MNDNMESIGRIGEIGAICIQAELLNVAIDLSGLQYSIIDQLKKMHIEKAKTILDNWQESQSECCRMHINKANEYLSKQAKINCKRGVLLERYKALNRRLSQIVD